MTILTLDGIRSLREPILAAASRRGATSVRVFGSIARGDATPTSDVDLLVRFDVGRSLLDQVHLADDLRVLLGVDVDVLSEGGLLDRDSHILDEAIPL